MGVLPALDQAAFQFFQFALAGFALAALVFPPLALPPLVLAVFVFAMFPLAPLPLATLVLGTFPFAPLFLMALVLDALPLAPLFLTTLVLAALLLARLMLPALVFGPLRRARLGLAALVIPPFLFAQLMFPALVLPPLALAPLDFASFFAGALGFDLSADPAGIFTSLPLASEFFFGSKRLVSIGHKLRLQAPGSGRTSGATSGVNRLLRDISRALRLFAKLYHSFFFGNVSRFTKQFPAGNHMAVYQQGAGRCFETPWDCVLPRLQFPRGIEPHLPGERRAGSQFFAQAAAVRAGTLRGVGQKPQRIGRRSAFGQAEHPRDVHGREVAIRRDRDHGHERFYRELFGQVARIAIGRDDGQRVVLVDQLDQLRRGLAPWHVRGNSGHAVLALVRGGDAVRSRSENRDPGRPVRLVGVSATGGPLYLTPFSPTLA